MKTYHYKIMFILMLTISPGCEDQLEEDVFSELSPSTLFTSEKGLNSLLNASYSFAHRSGDDESWSPYYLGTMPAGEVWGAGGSIESAWQSLIDYTWDSNHGQLIPVWIVYFSSIRDANLVLDNLDNDSFSNDYKQRTEAEVHFLRGWAYSELYKLFGRLPLYQSSNDDPLLPRSSDEETRAFIEQELLKAIATLPTEPLAFGRASQGVAMSVLAKFYLNTKQWQKAVDMSLEVMNLGLYSLLPNYSDVFDISNEGNAEVIWALPKNAAGAGQNLNALIFPPDYPRPFPNNSVFAARTYIFDDFVNSFEATDARTSRIITEWESTSTGQLVLGLGKDQSHPYKLPFDPNAVGPSAGNDIVVIRYADILLTRAEALNELNGPTQEAIDLVNEIRNRAGVIPLILGSFNKDSLRDAILREREWEFYFEGNAREDQIRHGVMISRARARGKNAQDFHVLYPIPQRELDANSNLEQNPGY
tara:strand:- start:991 stop:2418 length:1428 start_codon:yes stop_codon:yes gene_type:complete